MRVREQISTIVVPERFGRRASLLQPGRMRSGITKDGGGLNWQKPLRYLTYSLRRRRGVSQFLSLVAQRTTRFVNRLRLKPVEVLPTRTAGQNSKGSRPSS